MRFFVLLLALCVASLSQAQTLDVNAMLSELNSLKGNSILKQQTLQAGLDRASLCVHCHGQDGNSKRDYIPNLAAQNPEYLLVQFEHFASGKRQDYVMSKLAKSLTANDRVAVALYFSEQQVKPRASTPETSAQGEALYQRVCVACHGQGGTGDSQYPRIAGQPYEFLSTTLLNFQTNNQDRKDSPMTAVVKSLSDSELKAVAAYVANIP